MKTTIALAPSSLACTNPIADSSNISSASREDDETHIPVLSDSYGAVTSCDAVHFARHLIGVNGCEELR
ncbi:MAG: hypothetical protein U9N46_05610 [Euryarchaeota archaeon]|nr:hypothetical protein [Euryarchaeota archaeon]